jgi:Zn-dependent peptidase ImmA (M78 family)
MLPEIAMEDLATALDAVVEETLAAASVQEPPIDAVHLAQSLGLTLAWDDRQNGRARVVNLPSNDRSISPSILLKHDPRKERVQWTVAHEIGETLAQRVFVQLAVDASLAPQQAREMVANGMAARLLLPKPWFGHDGNQCDWELIRLKEIYTTASHELIARRMLDFSPPVIVAVFDQNRLTWRKSNTGFRLPQLSLREIACRREAYERSQTVYDDGPPKLRVWAVHEPHWKREILRLEIDEFATD